MLVGVVWKAINANYGNLPLRVSVNERQQRYMKFTYATNTNELHRHGAPTSLTG